MSHRAFALPSRPLQSNVALRVTAARASDIVLADGQVERDAATTAAPADHEPQSSARPTRRRRSRRGTPTGASR